MPRDAVGHYEWVRIYIECCRLFENLAGGWRSDAKHQAFALANWASAVQDTSKEFASLRTAMASLIDFSLTWEERIRPLAKHMPWLEKRVIESTRSEHTESGTSSAGL